MERKLDVSTSRKNRIENNRTEVLVIESNRIETHLYRFSPNMYIYIYIQRYHNFGKCKADFINLHMHRNKAKVKIVKQQSAFRAFSLYKTGSGFQYQIFSQLAEKIPS